MEKANAARNENREAEGKRREFSAEDFLELVETCPEVEELPEEVLQKILDGQKPVVAYLCYINRVLREKAEEFEQEKKNKESYTGSLQSDGADVQDSFLAAFMGGID